jgi:hypothetical protein
MKRQRRSILSRHGLLRNDAPPPPHYAIWKTMLQRCSNSNARDYQTYGGRGVEVCHRWRRFDNFEEDMGPQPSEGAGLQRIDPSRGFEPGNVMWSQGGRPGKAITHEDRTQSVAAWARELGIKEGTLRARLKKGMPVADALKRSVRGHRASPTQGGDSPPPPVDTMLKDLDSLRNAVLGCRANTRSGYRPSTAT